MPLTLSDSGLNRDARSTPAIMPLQRDAACRFGDFAVRRSYFDRDRQTDRPETPNGPEALLPDGMYDARVMQGA